MKDPEAAVRERAAWALGWIKAPGSAPALGAALKDPEAAVREQAAWALGHIGAARVGTALEAALKDPEPEVRVPSAWALGADRPSSRRPALAKAVEDPDQRVREEAIGTFERIAAQTPTAPSRRPSTPLPRRGKATPHGSSASGLAWRWATSPTKEPRKPRCPRPDLKRTPWCITTASAPSSTSASPGRRANLCRLGNWQSGKKTDLKGKERTWGWVSTSAQDRRQHLGPPCRSCARWRS